MEARYQLVARSLTTKIGFLNWNELDPSNVLDINDDIDRLFISPDVHSLHIVYYFKGAPNEWYHEMKDYPFDDDAMGETELIPMLKNWLYGQVGFDWNQCGFGEVWDLINDGIDEDYSDETGPRIITLWEATNVKAA